MAVVHKPTAEPTGTLQGPDARGELVEPLLAIPHGCFYKFGCLFLGVLSPDTKNLTIVAVFIGASDFGNSHMVAVQHQC